MPFPATCDLRLLVPGNGTRQKQKPFDFLHTSDSKQILIMCIPFTSWKSVENHSKAAANKEIKHACFVIYVIYNAAPDFTTGHCHFHVQCELLVPMDNLDQISDSINSGHSFSCHDVVMEEKTSDIRPAVRRCTINWYRCTQK